MKLCMSKMWILIVALVALGLAGATAKARHSTIYTKKHITNMMKAKKSKSQSWSYCRPHCYPTHLDQPFTLGVASGDPTHSQVTLWTRLAPNPLAGGGMPEQPVEVYYQVAYDAAMKHVVYQGSILAMPQDGHAVHYTATDLSPDTYYYYEFWVRVDDDDATYARFSSTMGRTKTLPSTIASPSELKFAFCSCSEYEFGYFDAYRHMALDDTLDFVVHLGDYIYETGNINPFLSPVRSNNNQEVVTIEQYRNRYALYALDPDLQQVRAAHPFFYVWDDHEVDNDWSRFVPEDPDNQSTDAFLERRSVATQVMYEHQALRHKPNGRLVQLHQEIQVGDLASIFLLDTRQYRTQQPCYPAPRANPPVPQDCPARQSPDLAILGDAQEVWLLDRLRQSTKQWNIVASPSWFSQFVYVTADMNATLINTDAWDGYPMQRQRIIDAVDAAGLSNVVIVSGDWHVFGVMDVKLDFDDATSRTVATEFGGVSISGVGPWAPIMKANLHLNPHVLYIEGDDLRAGQTVHGYTSVHVTPKLMTTELLALDTVKTMDSDISVLETFVVRNGVPGAVLQ